MLNLFNDVSTTNKIAFASSVLEWWYKSQMYHNLGTYYMVFIS